ncbi:MAG TPA: hypothetical protein VGD74_06615, partial [Vulgatibacter sp.]
MSALLRPPILAASLLLIALPAPSLAAAGDAEAESEELAELREAEVQAIDRGARAIERMLRQLGAENPWSRRLQGPLGLGLGGWPDIVDPGEPGQLVAGSLPFSIESVAGAYDIPVEFNESVAEYLA